jgi:hypothetical protein
MFIKGKIGRTRTKKYVTTAWWETWAKYFLVQNEDPDKMNNVGKALLKVINKSGLKELSAGDYSRFRVIPSVKQLEKTIEINQSIEAEKVVLPFEFLTEFLANFEDQTFYLVPCSCREAAKHSGEPCKRTNEKFCVANRCYGQSI